ncbi:substrate-binding domain-containing protein (plasmid) [Rhizobium sp. RCAM05350]|nr:substrate-binding domain-containing protein [Rhizobium sp. RCAM05350]
MELEKQGITRSTVPLLESAYKIEGGRTAMKRLMDLKERPTAIFCGSDIIAAGVIKYCHEHQIAVPGEISILGFDNLEIAELTTPDLTTVEVPAREMGTIAGDYLLATTAQRQHMRQRELPLRLVVRSSTAPIAR